MRRIKYGHLTLSGVFLDKVIPNNDFHNEAVVKCHAPVIKILL